MHPDCELALMEWHYRVSRQEWTNPIQVLSLFPNARFISSDRVVFNIKGNHYRLILKVNFDTQCLFVRFIGTHAEYDKIDALTV